MKKLILGFAALAAAEVFAIQGVEVEFPSGCEIDLLCAVNGLAYVK